MITITLNPFRMVISVPEFGERPVIQSDTGQIGVHDEVHDLSLTQTMRTILTLLSQPASTPQLLEQLGYTRRTRNYETSIKHLLEANLIEMTLPDKPRSKNQKYRLTAKGRVALGSQKKGVDH